MVRAILLVGLCGCFAAHSTIGPVVTDLHVTQDGIVVDRCDVHEDEDDHIGVSLFACMLTLGRGCAGYRTFDVTASACHRELSRFQDGAP